jgi:Sulfatase
MDRDIQLRPRASLRLAIGPAIVCLAALVAAHLARAGDDDFNGAIGTTKKDSKPDFPQPVRPKPASPNVQYILLDDVGFADLSSYGSEIQTLNIDGLAARGIRYTNFHTRSICSPTRAALLTGPNSQGQRTLTC